MDWRSVRYDAIVVGSGAAGGMAAKCLTDGGASVLVLEAGPLLPPESCGPRDRSREEFLARRARQPIQSQSLWYDRRSCHLYVDDLDHPYATEPGTAFNWIRSRHAGGRTLVWSRFALRLADEELLSGHADGASPPWPIAYRDLAPYYDRVERLLGVTGTAESLPALPDGCFVSRPVPNHLGELRRRLARRFPERHLVPSREVTGDATAAAPGSGPPASSSLGSTLRHADPRRLTFRTDCVVARITLDRPDHARGVIFVDRQRGQQHEVSGRVVVLCSSTIESTRLLLLSRTPEHPGGLGNSSGVLGRYLMDHFGGPRLVAIGRLDGVDAPSTERVYLPRVAGPHGRRDGFIRGYGIQGELQVWPGGTATLSLGVFGEVLPYVENSVAVDETMRDVDGLPVARIRFGYRDNEHRMGRHAAAAVRELVDAVGFRPLVVHEEILPPGTRAHELGSARMGASPVDSVLNPFNQCWEVENLFVTDGACFPSAGYKGPTLTIMALTARACDRVLDGLRRGRF